MPLVRILVASTRPRRLGPVVADWVRAQAPADVAIEVTDLAELALPFLDEPQLAATGVYAHEHTRRWAALVTAADALLVVTPEYNNGYPAALKNAIDYLYAEWHGKPIGLVGYGYRAATSCREQLRTVFGRVPVSYTHLDVYKRQRSPSAPLRCSTRAPRTPPTRAGSGRSSRTTR